jgi:photosystem II stability/assembly factor-like uncharacterized protein
MGVTLMAAAMLLVSAHAVADLAPGRSDKAQSLAVSPQFATDRTLFVGGYYLMWKSTDGGKRFALLEGAPKDIEDIALSPGFGNDRTLFVASKGNIYGVGAGIYRSSDAGASWQLASGGLPVDRMPYRLRISSGFEKDRTLVAMVNTDLYKTTDAGVSWKKITPPVDAYVMGVNNFSVSPSFGADGYIVAAQGYNETVAYSTTGGTSWGGSALDRPWFQGFDDVCVSSSFPVDRTVWVTKSGSIFRSTDGGARFARIAEGWGLIPTSLLVSSPQFATDATLLGGGSRISGPGSDPWTLVGRSADGGVTWAASEEGLGGQWTEDIDYSPDFATDRTVFAVTGGTFAGSFGGAFVSRDAGATWARLGGVPATLGTPTLSTSRPAKKKRFYVSGTLPAHAAVTSVKLQFFRKGSSGYPVSPTTSVTVSVPSGAGSFRKSVTLPSTGSWQVREYHLDADHPESYSARKSFAVR